MEIYGIRPDQNNQVRVRGHESANSVRGWYVSHNDIGITLQFADGKRSFFPWSGYSLHEN